MYHVAIMRKSWHLTEKILSGKKTIESRWYRNMSRPWGMVAAGDTIYFKDTGEAVTAKATIDKVLSFENLTPQAVHELLEKYHTQDGIPTNQIEYYYELFRSKRYCLLMFLKDAVAVEPFEVSKTGFGTMAAWLCAETIEELKV
jgi:ASC-1-like (ASCH) protein